MKSAILESMNNKYDDIRLANQSEFIIGKSSKCSHKLAHKYISNQHARLSFENGSYYITDLHSTNGTFLNGIQLSDSQNFVPLKSNDIIRLGSINFRFKLITQSNTDSTSAVSPGDSENVLDMFTEKKPKTSKKLLDYPSKRNPFATYRNGIKDENNVHFVNTHNNNSISSNNANSNHNQQQFLNDKIDELKNRVSVLENENQTIKSKHDKLRKSLQLTRFIYEKNKAKLNRLVAFTKKNNQKSLVIKNKLINSNKKRKMLNKKLRKLKSQVSKLTAEKNEMTLKLKAKTKCATVVNALEAEGTTTSATTTSASSATNSENKDHDESFLSKLAIAETDAKLLKHSKQMEEIINEDLVCCVCHEIFIQPFSVDCGHTFCKFCLNEWAKKNSHKEDCPICRKPITACQKVLILDQLIEKLLVNQDNEALSLRKRMTEDRDKVAQNYAAVKRLSDRTRVERNDRPRFSNAYNLSSNDWEEDSLTFEAPSGNSLPFLIDGRAYVGGINNAIYLGSSDDDDDEDEDDDDEDEEDFSQYNENDGEDDDDEEYDDDEDEDDSEVHIHFHENNDGTNRNVVPAAAAAENDDNEEDEDDDEFYENEGNGLNSQFVDFFEEEEDDDDDEYPYEDDAEPDGWNSDDYYDDDEDNYF